MHFIVIFGPPAVGKMTVGTELARLTGFKLFHNHMTIDLVLPFFGFGTPQFSLVGEFRRRIFEEVAASTLPGLIFTYVWALDQESNRAFIDDSCAIFRARGARISFIELAAEVEVRLERNESPFRLEHKPFKRDLPASRARLLQDDATYRLNSNGDFFYPLEHLRIDNTRLTPVDVAWSIVRGRGLPILPGPG